MLRKLAALAVAAALIALAAFWLLTAPATVEAGSLPPRNPDLANGRTMFFAGGCAGCHATKEEPTKLAGGLALRSPFGTFYVPNISPHQTDGIGAWNEAQFVTAMMKGTSPAGEHLFPSFPYTSYQRMKVEDVRDLFAFIKTLEPLAGKVRGHDVPFPFNIRRSVGIWKLLFLDGRPFQPDAGQSPEWNRGAYLVNGPGHCAECHSPRNMLGAIIVDKRFSGGPAPDGQGGVPNITQAKLKNWSVDDFADLLDSGMTPDADFVGGSMAAVVRHTSQLSKEDRRAMAVYLKSLAPIESATNKQ